MKYSRFSCGSAGKRLDASSSSAVRPRLARQGAPQVVDLLLQVVLALLAPRLFLAQRQPLRAAVAVDAVVHQRMAGVEQVLDRPDAVALLAFADVVPRVDQVVDDRRRIGPHLEQVVALEEAVVAVGRMGDHQGLHGHGVFFHQVGDAGIGVDDDLVGQAHVAAAVVLLGGDELLAVGPVAVDHRHAHRGIGVHHLLGRDDLELVGVGVEPVAPATRAISAWYCSISSKVQSEGWAARSRPCLGRSRRSPSPS